MYKQEAILRMAENGLKPLIGISHNCYLAKLESRKANTGCMGIHLYAMACAAGIFARWYCDGGQGHPLPKGAGPSEEGRRGVYYAPPPQFFNF